MQVGYTIPIGAWQRSLLKGSVLAALPPSATFLHTVIDGLSNFICFISRNERHSVLDADLNQRYEKHSFFLFEPVFLFK